MGKEWKQLGQNGQKCKQTDRNCEQKGWKCKQTGKNCKQMGQKCKTISWAFGLLLALFEAPFYTTLRVHWWSF